MKVTLPKCKITIFFFFLKIINSDLGVHLDGYIALVSHTIVVSSEPAKVTIDGPKADAFHAAWNCI